MTETSEAIAEVEAAEKAVYQAASASAAAALAELLSDEFHSVHFRGIEDDKSEYLVGIETGAFKYGATTRLDGRTEVYGELAVTVGTLEVEDRTSAKLGTIRLEQTLVWRKEGGAWKLLHRQGTRNA